MRRTFGIVAAAALAVFAAGRLRAQQEWSPPSRDMPQMPATSELSGGWRGSLAAWFRTAGDLSGVRAMGEGGGARPRMVRFMGGARPVATWTDRNGDGRADIVEIYQGGALAYQLVDADYDGSANVLRVYDASGSLARENRY
jgi:hypothetical protein